ncbi:MAG: hypothetical protein DPW16_19390 [Chloroflexi bacterium]|nr:hypothetical protein [Chloroflexota bacterium]
MRISLWQQFSSNHSGSYHIIGTFKTIEDARRVYEEIGKILHEIDDWYRENPNGLVTSWNNGGPLPPESAIAERLGIEWPETIDWAGWAEYYRIGSPNFEKNKRDPSKEAERLIDEAIMVLANTVIARNPDQTHMGGITFKNLLEYFGAEISGEGYDPSSKVVGREDVYEFEILHFTAPNEETANQIENAIRAYVEDRKSDTHLPPWYDHAANFGKILPNSPYLKDKQVEIWRQKAKERIEFRSQSDKLSRVRMENHALISAAELWREGLGFRFEKIIFADGNYGLAALIAYLEANGFTDIRISYGYVPREPEDY